MRLEQIYLPTKLAEALKRIDWDLVEEKHLDLLINIGVPYLAAKGYFKEQKGESKNEHFKTNSSQP